MRLDDMTFARIEQAVADGWVRRQVHPVLPYVIYNYTKKTQVNWQWNDITTMCRGLIIDINTREVLARPYAKFFNVGEKGAFVPKPGQYAMAIDKMDGSLGILYPTGDHLFHSWAIATRGSFTSEQANKANDILMEKYNGWRPLAGFTYLFEIIYPDNRIVVDYQGMEDLVLLGGVQTDTGNTVAPAFLHWPGPRAECFGGGPWEELMAAQQDRPGKEGYVLYFPEDNTFLKVKQEDYLTLHRIVTGLTEVSVWEAMSRNDFDELLDSLPEELREWAVDVSEDILLDRISMNSTIMNRWYELVEQGLVDRENRKPFAMAIKDEPAWLKACLFARLDGKGYAHILWAQCKPSADKVKPVTNTYTTGTGQKLYNVHSKERCATRYCVIHNPSDHALANAKTHWRADRGIMERICEHGVGHPDPDDINVMTGDGVHTCDGCCRGHRFGPEEELPGLWQYSDFA